MWRADGAEALFGSDDDGDDDDGAMDDDFGGALGDLSGSDPESDAAPAQQNELLSDGDGEDAAGDEFGGSEDDDDDDAGGAVGGMDGDTSDDDGEEGAEAGGSGSEEELETRAERQSRRLDKLKCVACRQRRFELYFTTSLRPAGPSRPLCRTISRCLVARLRCVLCSKEPFALR